MWELLNVLDAATENTTICGGIAVPNEIFNLTALIIKGIKIVVPILLIIWGMLDFAKSIIAKKEEDIKKYRSAFIGRLISAALVFLVIVIVQLVVNLVDGVEKQSSDGETICDALSCSKKFINGVEKTDSENSKDSEESSRADNDTNSDIDENNE